MVLVESFSIVFTQIAWVSLCNRIISGPNRATENEVREGRGEEMISAVVERTQCSVKCAGLRWVLSSITSEREKNPDSSPFAIFLCLPSRRLQVKQCCALFCSPKERLNPFSWSSDASILQYLLWDWALILRGWIMNISIHHTMWFTQVGHSPAITFLSNHRLISAWGFLIVFPIKNSKIFTYP